MPKEDNNGNQIWRALRLIGARSCKPGRHTSPARAPDPPLVGTYREELLGCVPKYMAEINYLKCLYFFSLITKNSSVLTWVSAVEQGCKRPAQSLSCKSLFPAAVGPLAFWRQTSGMCLGGGFHAQGAEVPPRDALPSPPSLAGGAERW